MTRHPQGRVECQHVIHTNETESGQYNAKGEPSRSHNPSLPCLAIACMNMHSQTNAKKKHKSVDFSDS